MAKRNKKFLIIQTFIYLANQFNIYSNFISTVRFIPFVIEIEKKNLEKDLKHRDRYQKLSFHYYHVVAE